MKMHEYLDRVEIIKMNINGCDCLIDFYQNKKKVLIDELNKLLNIELQEAEND